MSYQTILIVDDNPENLRLLELVLLNDNFTVQTANSAMKALEALSSKVPDALLTDIQMPDTDGLEFIRQVRLNPLTNGILILAVSANAMKQSIDEAFAAGCDGYITKPIDTRTFAASVREQMKRGRTSETNPPNVSAASEDDLLLHREFLVDCHRQVEKLLSYTNDSVRRERAGSTLHQCAATGGVLGHPEITALARDLETRSSALNELEFSGGLSRLSEVLEHLLELTPVT